MAQLPNDVLDPLLSVDGSYLDAAFYQIRLDYGNLDWYYVKELGVGRQQIAILPRRMLV